MGHLPVSQKLQNFSYMTSWIILTEVKGPRFLRSLDSNAIKKESDEVKDAVFTILSYEEIVPERDAARYIHKLTNMITDAPLSPSSLPAITSGWTGLEWLMSSEATTSLMLRKQRSHIMLINYTPWYWLDVFIVDKCKSILNGQKVPDGKWLMDLVRDVEFYHQSHRDQSIVLKATDYGINLPNAVYTVRHNYRRPSFDMERIAARVIATLVHVLEKWLDYPLGEAARLKAWFVHVVVNEFGVNALYLDGMWKVYSNLRGHLFKDGDWYIDSFKAMRPLRSAASGHPLYDPTSPEREAINEMAQLIDDLTTDCKHSIDRRMVESGLYKDALDPGLQLIADHEMHVFVSFLQQSLDYTTGQHVDHPAHPKLAKWLHSKPDKHLAFRELAPSRARARSNEGPFAKGVIRTTAGIFSAVVWRGITFGTEFALKGQMVFESADEFDAIRLSLNKPEAYFCDKAAYGRSNPHRSTGLAQEYWKSLQGGIWEKLVSKHIVPFLECWRFFMSKKNGTMLFPQLGPLASYLLTADLYYAGVVTKPTVDDMSTIIHQLNKGAVAGLERLRLISPRPKRKRSKGKSNKEECRRAFQHIADIIFKAVPLNMHSSLRVDLILVEHALCKYSRASVRNLLSFK